MTEVTVSNFKIVVFSILLLAVVWVFASNNPKPETRVKLFCAYNRVFIEFHEQNNIWGTMWLDNNGQPVGCGDMPMDEKTNYKGTV